MEITAQEFSDRMRDLYGLLSGDLAKSALENPANKLYADIRKRVFTGGKNSNDQAIGQYSTTPFYANRAMFVKPSAFVPQGKRGFVGDVLVPKSSFKKGTKPQKNRVYKEYVMTKKDGTLRKTMYLPQGYKQLREIQALRTDTIDLQYRKDLIKSFQIGREGQAYLIGFTEIRESQKRLQLENRFGPIFYATDKEKKTYLDAVGFTLTRLTNGVLESGQRIVPTFE